MEKNIKIGNKIYFVASDDNYLDAMGDNFEPCMVQLFRALISSNAVVADIGANIGLTAMLFSSLARKVFAFEPSPSTYNILTGNLTRAGVTNVEAINLGLGHKTDSLTITFAKNNRSGGYVSDKIRPETGCITEEIRIDTLDNYFADSEIAPNFLKIDVEGFEQNVIKGGSIFLPKNKPTVVMEMNHFCLDVLQRITIPDFLDFMRSVFPYLYAIDTDNVIIIDLHDSEQAYFVMHEHVTKHRFPNLVGEFDQSIKTKLDALAAKSKNVVDSFATHIESSTDRSLGKTIEKLVQKLVRNKPFETPPVTESDGFLQADSIPAFVLAGQVFEIPVKLTNNSKKIWYGYGTHPVLLCYHWQNTDGGYLIYDGMRTELKNQVVHPGKQVQEMVRVFAPSEKGSFNLILTVVQEGVCWFEDRGFKALVASISVD